MNGVYQKKVFASFFKKKRLLSFAFFEYRTKSIHEFGVRPVAAGSACRPVGIS
jgi:hypothetical protein